MSLSRSVVSTCVLAGVAALAAPALAADDPPLPPELIAAPPESVHSRMDYGPHAGMQVSVLGMEGRDTAHAVIRFAHTRDNAISYCRDSLSTVTEECVQDALDIEKDFKDSFTGNCDTGEFSDFFGLHYRFEGRNPKSGYFGDNKYLIVNLADGEIADGSRMSRYLINLSVYRALCHARGCGSCLSGERHHSDQTGERGLYPAATRQEGQRRRDRRLRARRVHGLLRRSLPGEPEHQPDLSGFAVQEQHHEPGHRQAIRSGHGRFKGAPADAGLPCTMPRPRAVRRIAEVGFPDCVPS